MMPRDVWLVVLESAATVVLALAVLVAVLVLL